MSVSNPVIDYVDPVAKRIYLRAGVREYHPVTDIYTEIRYLRRVDESLRPFDMPISAFGNEPKGGGRFTSRYARFNNGWKVVPEDVSHSLYVSGEQITDEGQSGPAAIDTTVLSPGTSVIIHYEPPAAELVRADAEIQIIVRTAYQGMVVYDAANGEPGTALGIGTHYRPVNNFTDAKIIAQNLGLTTIFLQPGAAVIPAGMDLSGFIIKGNNALTCMLMIEAGANVSNCEIITVALTGVLSGSVIVRESYIFDLDYFGGFMFQCQLAGELSIESVLPASIMQCFTGIDGATIDLNGSNHMAVFSAFNGSLTFINKNDADPVQVYMNAGHITLAPSVTNTQGLQLSGTARFTNNTGLEVPHNHLLSSESIDDKLAPRFTETNKKIDETQAFVLAS